MRLSRIRIVLILFVFVFSAVCAIQAETESFFKSDSIFGIETPEDFKKSFDLPSFLRDDEPLTYSLPRPIGGFGNLHVVIETVDSVNHKVASQKAVSAELRLGHNVLSRLEASDVKVIDNNKSRFFDFPIHSLRSGYYFITVRLFSDGVMWKNRKYHDEIFQVGIHEGRTTNLRRKITFLHW